MLHARPGSLVRWLSGGNHSSWLWILCLLLACPGAARAEDPVMSRGNAAVTQFSGPRTDANVPKDVHPLDVTFIDTEGAALRVLDLSKLGGAPAGQVADAPAVFSVKAKDIGQVFGLALDSQSTDQPPNIYAAATSLYGLQIVGERDGKTIRLVKGEPGAKWMPGQFALEQGGGPGSIWRIDGGSGEVSLFSTITSGNLENAGPGLGAIAFDRLSQQLYVSSLETGLIHRLDGSGRELSTFDHGTTARPRADLDPVADDPSARMSIESPAFNVEDPATWGYADKKRLVVALAVENDRLYYSVADGPVIWSVGLGVDGSFLGDARLEIDVTGTPNNNLITAIAFDGPETMYLSQRGESAGSYGMDTFARPQKSSVLRYRWNTDSNEWVEAPEEYAVGLEPVHRATNGGLALGYGYNASGNIDFGTCRQTLWTTGEHLKPGEQHIHGLQGSSTDAAQTPSDARPKSGSTALQGNFGDVSEKILDAPDNTWLTDSDDAIEGPAAHGYVGSIAIFAPCEDEIALPETSNRPLPEPWPPKPPRSVPGVYIEKQCFPGLPGGPITCRITVTNTGIEPIAPISVTDVSTVLAGPGAGGAVTILSSTPDAPGWFCTPTPTAAFSCLLPAAALPGGTSRFFDVVIDTGPLAVAGNWGFRNCASLDAPYSGIACAEGGNGTSGLVISKTGPALCNPGTNCTFTLAINNTGTQAFNGNIQISDSMFVGGASVVVPVVATNLNCIGGNPATLPFTCTVPGSIPAGGSQTYSITVAMPAAPPNYWAQNCFAAFDPAFVPPGGPFPSPGGPGGPGFGSPTNPACHWVAAGAPPPQSNLRITKANTGVTCDSSLGTGIASCRYSIAIQNDGPSPFNNVISLTETVPAGVNLILNPAWPCAGPGPAFTCTSPAAVPIAPGGVFNLTATIQIPALATEPTCTVPNTVAINSPVGAPSNILAGDDTSTAVHNTALIAVLNPDGTWSVACDPTNLKTEKKVERCTASGDSSTCTYSVTVSNTGPDPYRGPITVNDTFSAAPSSLSFPAGWSCAGEGAGFICTRPDVQLAPPGGAGAQSISFEVTATVPHGAQCTIRNTAHMTFPLPGTRFNQLGFDDQSTVSTPVPSPECQRKPTCKSPEEGEIASISGACACEEGLVRDADGRCTPVEETPEPTEPEPTEPPPAETCPDGNPIPRNGVCPCEAGTKWNEETNTCEGLCEPGENEYRTSAGQCVCKTGYTRQNGVCRSTDGPGPSPSCKPGPNEYYDREKDECFCKRGFDRNNYGVCERVVTPIDPGPIDPPGIIPIYCSPDEYRAAPGICCRLDEELIGDYCVRVTEPPPPPCRLGPNEYRLSRTQCVCLPFHRRNHNGVCVIEDNVRPCGRGEYRAAPGVCCDFGDVYIDGKCRSATKICPDGSEVPRGISCPEQCRHGQFRAAPGVCCDYGEVYYNGKCHPDEGDHSCPRGDDRCRCLESGGTWNSQKKACNVDTFKKCPDGSVIPRRMKCPDRPPTACRANDTECFCKLRGLPYNKKENKCGSEDACKPGDARCKCERTGGQWKNGKCLTAGDGGDGAKACPNPRQVRDDKGVCRCRPNDEFCSGAGIAPPGGGEDGCKKGDRKCKCEASGGSWKKGKCVTASGPSPQEICTKQGGSWKNGKCVTASEPSPQEICTKQGGTWKKGKCVTASEPSPQELCAKQGGKWKKGKCVTASEPSPQELCAKQGGKWKNGKCRTGRGEPPKTSQPPKQKIKQKQKELKQQQQQLKQQQNQLKQQQQQLKQQQKQLKQQQKQKNQQQKNKPPPRKCPPGKHPDPAKGGKCVKDA